MNIGSTTMADIQASARDEIAKQRLRREQLERVIARGMKTFREVGEALLEIREMRLYQSAGCATFDEYCQKRWGFKSSRARQLINAAKIAAEVAASGAEPPSTERQAREIIHERRIREEPPAAPPASIAVERYHGNGSNPDEEIIAAEDIEIIDVDAPTGHVCVCPTCGTVHRAA